MTGTPQSVREVVEAFFGAMARHDFERAMEQVSARAFEFIGPVRSYQGRDQLASDLDRLYPVLARLEVRRVFVDGDESCVIYDLVTTVPGMELTRVAVWITVADDGIVRMEVFFDAHAYAQLFEV